MTRRLHAGQVPARRVLDLSVGDTLRLQTRNHNATILQQVASAELVVDRTEDRMRYLVKLVGAFLLGAALVGAAHAQPSVIKVDFDPAGTACNSSSPDLLFEGVTNYCSGGVYVVRSTGLGDMLGPAGSTDNLVPRFSGTGGKTVDADDDGIFVDDAGNVQWRTRDGYWNGAHPDFAVTPGDSSDDDCVGLNAAAAEAAAAGGGIVLWPGGQLHQDTTCEITSGVYVTGAGPRYTVLLAKGTLTNQIATTTPLSQESFMGISGVHIDANGQTVGAGISMQFVSDVVIHDVQLDGQAVPVDLDGNGGSVQGALLSHVNAQGFTVAGIRLQDNANAITIIGGKVSGTGIGLDIIDSRGIEVSGATRFESLATGVSITETTGASEGIKLSGYFEAVTTGVSVGAGVEQVRISPTRVTSTTTFLTDATGQAVCVDCDLGGSEKTTKLTGDLRITGLSPSIELYESDQTPRFRAWVNGRDLSLQVDADGAGGGAYVSGVIVQEDGSVDIPSLVSCDTIDTDANGALSCGTDGGGGGGGTECATSPCDLNAATTLGGAAVQTGAEASASATVSGNVELATLDETDTGTDATRAVTPAGLATIQGEVAANTAKVSNATHTGDVTGSVDLTIAAAAVDLAMLAAGDPASGAVFLAGDNTWKTPAGSAVNTADIADVSVTQTELAELQTIGSTSISAADWTAVANLAGVNTGNQSLFATVTATTGTSPVAGGASDVLNIAAGAGISVTGDEPSDTITIANTQTPNATHTGDVTGSVALTIAAGSVDPAMMSATGTPDATTFLRGDNTWEVPAGGGGGEATTYEVLDTNGDIGFNSAQVPAGDLTAPLASPLLTGDPVGPTPGVADNDTSLATTAFVATAIAGQAEFTRTAAASLSEAADSGAGSSGSPWLISATGWDPIKGGWIYAEPGYYQVAHGAQLDFSSGTYVECAPLWAAIFTLPGTQRTTSGAMFLVPNGFDTGAIVGCAWESGVTVDTGNTCQTVEGTCSGGSRDTLACDCDETANAGCTDALAHVDNCPGGGTCSTAGRDTAAGAHYVELGTDNTNSTITRLRLVDNRFGAVRRTSGSGGGDGSPVYFGTGSEQVEITGNWFGMANVQLKGRSGSNSVAGVRHDELSVERNTFDMQDATNTPCGLTGVSLDWRVGLSNTNQWIFEGVTVAENRFINAEGGWWSGGQGSAFVFRDHNKTEGLLNDSMVILQDGPWDTVHITDNVCTQGAATTTTQGCDVQLHDTSTATISGNTINSTDATFFVRLFGADDVSIVGNKYNGANATADATLTAHSLVRVDSASANVHVVGNTLTDVGNLAYAFATCDGCVLSHNTMGISDTVTGETVDPIRQIIGGTTWSNSVALFNRVTSGDCEEAQPIETPAGFALLAGNACSPTDSSTVFSGPVGLEQSGGGIASFTVSNPASVTTDFNFEVPSDGATGGDVRIYGEGEALHIPPPVYFDGYGTTTLVDSLQDEYSGLTLVDVQDWDLPGGTSNSFSYVQVSSNDGAVHTGRLEFEGAGTVDGRIEIAWALNGTNCGPTNGANPITIRYCDSSEGCTPATVLHSETPADNLGNLIQYTQLDVAALNIDNLAVDMEMTSDTAGLGAARCKLRTHSVRFVEAGFDYKIRAQYDYQTTTASDDDVTNRPDCRPLTLANPSSTQRWYFAAAPRPLNFATQSDGWSVSCLTPESGLSSTIELEVCDSDGVTGCTVVDTLTCDDNGDTYAGTAAILAGETLFLDITATSGTAPAQTGVTLCTD